MKVSDFYDNVSAQSATLCYKTIYGTVDAHFCLNPVCILLLCAKNMSATSKQLQAAAHYFDATDT